jgi:hypothetical protein
VFPDPGPSLPLKRPLHHIHFQHFSICLCLLLFFKSKTPPPKRPLHHIHFQHALFDFLFIYYCFLIARLLPLKQPFITVIFITFPFSFHLLFFILIQNSSPKTCVHHIHLYHFSISIYFYLSVHLRLRPQ